MFIFVSFRHQQKLRVAQVPFEQSGMPIREETGWPTSIRWDYRSNKKRNSFPVLYYYSILRFGRGSSALTLAMILLIWNRAATRRRNKSECCLALGAV